MYSILKIDKSLNLPVYQQIDTGFPESDYQSTK